MAASLMSVRVSPSFEAPVLIQLKNRRMPGRPQNYYVDCESPTAALASETEAVGSTARHPDLKRWEVPVPTEAAMHLFDLLEHARIPPLSGGAMGLDGCSYEVCLGDEWGGARYRWWCTPPQGWEALGEVVATLSTYAGASGVRAFLKPLKTYKVP